MKKNQLIGLVVVLVIIVVAVIAVAMHSSKSDNGMNMSGSSSSSSAVASNNVTIQNYMFGPMAVKVKVGTTVTWTNKDAVSHTVTADTVSADAPSSMDIAQGKSFSYTFKKAGTYTYHCFPHPYMHGSVVVTN